MCVDGAPAMLGACQGFITEVDIFLKQKKTCSDELNLLNISMQGKYETLLSSEKLGAMMMRIMRTDVKEKSIFGSKTAIKTKSEICCNLNMILW